MEDTDLVARMAAGDQAAISELYDRHSGALLALARRIVRHRENAEDLVHDVFLEAWRAAATFDPERGRVWTWLAVRLRSRALDLLRSARVAHDGGSEPLDHMASRDRLPSARDEHLRRAIATLRGEDRRVLELAYVGGMSCSEIARHDTVPLGTVKSRLANGLAQLRVKLGQRVAA